MEDKLYYLQSIKHRGFIGNSVLWWAENSRGYTCNIDKAGIYSEKEARKIYLGGHGGIIAWPVEYIDSIISRHVDGQHMTDYSQGRKWEEELPVRKKLKRVNPKCPECGKFLNSFGSCSCGVIGALSS